MTQLSLALSVLLQNFHLHLDRRKQKRSVSCNKQDRRPKRKLCVTLSIKLSNYSSSINSWRERERGGEKRESSVREGKSVKWSFVRAKKGSQPAKGESEMAVSRPERLAGGRANILYGTIADSRTTKTKRQARDGSGNWLLCLLSLIMLLSSQQVVASLNQELTSGGERQQQQQQQQQPLQSATIIPLESVASNDDLDGENSSNGNNNSNMTSNSIRDNNLIPKHQQHQRNWKSSNSIAAPTGEY